MEVRSTISDPGRLAAVAKTGLLDGAPQESFERLVRLASRFLDAPVAFIGLVAAEREFFIGEVGLPPEVAARREFPLELGVCRHVVELGRPLVVPDARDDAILRESSLLLLYPTFAYVGFPLRVGHETVGAFCAVEPAARAWSPEELETLEDLAALATVELDLRVARREAEESIERVEAQQATLEEVADAQASLRRMATAVAVREDADALCLIAAEEAARLTAADGGLVVFFSEPEPRVVASWTPEGRLGPPWLGRSATEWAALRRGQPIRDHGHVGVPVVKQTAAWGAVVALGADATHFSPAAEDWLTRLAELLGIGLDNADTHAALAMRAATDPLTELANRRAFAQRLDEELERGRRHGRPVAVVLFDLDRLKEINDLHGHQAGDRALLHVAARARSSVREGELLARLAGDEFALVLPETEADGARAAAERIRAEIARLAVAGPERLRVTVSAGVAESGPDGTGQELLAVADRALYRAKAGGRNTVAR
jgi:diguanylate cyclase (GGDEF)-like protein